MAKRPKIANAARAGPSRAATRTRGWRAKFIAHLARRGNVTEAAEAVGVDRRTAQRHKTEDPAFAEDWDDALERFADLAEAEADRRGIFGEEEPVIYEGAPVFVLVDAQGRLRPPLPPGKPTPKGWKVVALTRRKTSDGLLMKRLAAVRPDKYRERVQVTHDKPDGAGPRTPAERAGEAAALLAELREQLGPEPGRPGGPAEG